MSASSLLDGLYRAGHLRAIDHALAQTLRRLDPATPDAVLAAAALASLAVSRGHAGFMPTQPLVLLDADVAWPQPGDWLRQLQASPWVATPTDGLATSATSAPLVLEHGLLYLRRYREYERRLAQGLRRIGRHAPAPGDIAALAPLFGQLFPDAAGGDDRQARAAALALRHALLLVTGGPGTGKTTTITRVLVLLAAQARRAGQPALRMALAAPTGRAAERMADSLRHAVHALTALGVDTALCAQLPEAGTTLHRLLGTIPDSPHFRHHADNPLPFDVVVVDEASMIDLPLMAKLVEAVADGARLLLLGDPDQLPSVEAGDVLAAIVAAAGDGDRLGCEDAEALASLAVGASRGGAASTAPASPASDRTLTALPARRVHLDRGYRQDACLDLAPLATAVRDGDAATALSLLRGHALSGVHFHEDLADPLAADAGQALLAPWRAIVQGGSDDPAAALRLAGSVRLLTALRDGPQGASALNARIEHALAGAQRETYFHGRLLLVTENSYRLNLFNGDIGVCLRGAGDGTTVWFGGGSDGMRGFHPAALPAHAGAFAMTVHKAQGSEFDAVWLLLPREPTRGLSRELVYTAITRARTQLHLCARDAVLRAALARRVERVGGLAWRLIT